jgi:hypothetical protein
VAVLIGQRAHLALLDVRAERRIRQAHQLHPAADHVLQRIGRLGVRHVVELDAGQAATLSASMPEKVLGPSVAMVMVPGCAFAFAMTSARSLPGSPRRPR